MANGFSRRMMLGAAALPLVAIGRGAGAAEFEYKFATGQSPTNPINTRIQEAIDRIAKGTGGRLTMEAVPEQPAGVGHGPDQPGAGGGASSS